MTQARTQHLRQLEFGSFITPTASDPQHAVRMAQASEAAGFGFATFPDHPYQPNFLDTWTLLSYAAAATSRVRLTPNVINLPLRPPAVLARSAASLDLLSGGRFELALGAGAFWDAIVAMGGPRRTPGEAVGAVEEAIAVIRGIWDTESRGGVRVDGEHYQVVGAKRGPAPAHPIGIWIGAYGPRMLDLLGRLADGSVPSWGYLKDGRKSLEELNSRIDEAAGAAGRDPRQIVRALNTGGQFGTGSDYFTGTPADWAEQAAELAGAGQVDLLIVPGDDPDFLARFGAEVIPAARELLETGDTAAADPADQRSAPEPVRPSAAERPAQQPQLPTPTPAPARVLAEDLLGEHDRPSAPPPSEQPVTERGVQSAQHLINVHNGLRAELESIRDLIEQVRAGALSVGDARSAIAQATLAQNVWTLGAYCSRYCTFVATHHTLEDQSLFPAILAGQPSLAPVMSRLEAEHHLIHEHVVAVDRALVALAQDPADDSLLRRAVDALGDTLLSHLAWEEEMLVEPISRSRLRI